MSQHDGPRPDPFDSPARAGRHSATDDDDAAAADTTPAGGTTPTDAEKPAAAPTPAGSSDPFATGTSTDRPGYLPPAAPPAAGTAATGTAGPGATGPKPVAGPEKPATDKVSIAALITGVLTLGVVPLVLGIIGIRRTGAGKLRGRWVAVIGTVLGVLGLAGWVTAGLLVFNAVSEHDDLLADLREQCTAGDMASCDTLYLEADQGSDDEEFARTCGDRSDEVDPGHCADYSVAEDGTLQPGPDATTGTDQPMEYGEDESLDAMYDACAAGDSAQCDQLFLRSPLGSDYESFGRTCGGRTDGVGYCVDAEGAAAPEGEAPAEGEPVPEG